MRRDRACDVRLLCRDPEKEYSRARDRYRGYRHGVCDGRERNRTADGRAVNGKSGRYERLRSEYGAVCLRFFNERNGGFLRFSDRKLLRRILRDCDCGAYRRSYGSACRRPDCGSYRRSYGGADRGSYRRSDGSSDGGSHRRAYRRAR